MKKFETEKMKVNLIPYTTVDGIPTFRDSEIKALFEQMEDDDAAGMVFYDELIQDPIDFLTFMRRSDVFLYIILVNGRQVGAFWLNRHEARFARAHWYLVKSLKGKALIEVGRYVPDTLIHMKNRQDGDYLYDMFMGIIPAENRTAIRFVTLCGARVLGEIPNAAMWNGKSVPGAIVYYTRETIREEKAQ